MPRLDDVNMREFYEGEKRQEEALVEWQNNRIVKKCQCGKAYSYDKSENDPGNCPSCGGREGELIY